MKKFLVMLLCAAMLICMASVVSAVEVKEDRMIEMAIGQANQPDGNHERPYVYAGDTIYIVVDVIDRNDEEIGLVNAEWTVTYNPDYFVYNGYTAEHENTVVVEETDGVLKSYNFITEDDKTYGARTTLVKYSFTAIAQTEKKTAEFGFKDTYTYTYMESIQPDSTFAAFNNGTHKVDIDLIDYDVEKIFGMEGTEGKEVKGDEIEIPYNDAEHFFKVNAYDSRNGAEATGATITYVITGFAPYDPDAALLVDPAEIIGQEVTCVEDLKKQGTYEIEYNIAPEIGYAAKSGDFTVNIVRPEFEIEVSIGENSDYVTGKKLILVYTDTDNVYFEYDGNVMLDVTASGYKLGNATPYDHVFGFVADAIDGGSYDDYAALVKNIYDGTDVVTVVYEDEDGGTDLNFSGSTTIQDISVAYGIYNVVDGYFADTKWQKNILKADIDHSKNVEPQGDLTPVVLKVYPIAD